MAKLTYFITGTTKGVPLALVKILLSQGHKVIATVHHRQSHIETELLIANNPNLTLLHLDFTERSSFEKLGEDLEILNTVIDVFISHATLSKDTENDPLLETSYHTLMKYFQINTLGPLALLRVLKPFMEHSRVKKIILTSSALNDRNSKGEVKGTPYNIAKAGLGLIGSELADELRDEGFIVVNYYPGSHKCSDRTGGDAMEIEEVAETELKIVESLTLEQSGKYLDYKGNDLRQ